MTMPKCKACKAEIRFIKLKSGKAIPVNPSPAYIEDGNGKEIIITDDGRISNGRLEIVTSQNQFLTRGYISHFATCPFANNFRRR